MKDGDKSAVENMVRREKTFRELKKLYSREAHRLECQAVVDRNLGLWFFTEKFLRNLGYKQNDLVGKNFGDFLPNGGKDKIKSIFPMRRKEVRVGDVGLRHKNGSRVYFEVTARKLKSGYALLDLRDNTRAATDGLTGLMSRAVFEDVAGHELKFVSRLTDEVFCFFYFDINRFKEINDNQGHAEGDEALKIVARALRESFRESDLVCRWGGDEFVVLSLLPAQKAEEAAAAMLSRLDEKLRESSGKKEYDLAISVGREITGADSPLSLAELIRRADRNMYAAKRAGKKEPDKADPGFVRQCEITTRSNGKRRTAAIEARRRFGQLCVLLSNRNELIAELRAEMAEKDGLVEELRTEIRKLRQSEESRV